MECAFSQALRWHAFTPRQQTLLEGSCLTALAGFVAYEYLSTHYQPGWMGGCLRSGQAFVQDAVDSLRKSLQDDEEVPEVPVELVMAVLANIGR